MNIIPPNFHLKFRVPKNQQYSVKGRLLKVKFLMTLTVSLIISTTLYGQVQVKDNKFSATSKNTSLSLESDETFYNYPNPFTSSTTIHYSIDQYSFVQLKLFDRYGRFVKTLVSEKQFPGQYKVSWDAIKENGKDAPGGLYFAKLWSQDRVKLLKIYLAEK